jgi:hypothetical protein
MNIKEVFKTRNFHILGAILLTAFFAFGANAQGREQFTGTVVFYGDTVNPRTVSTNFSLYLTGKTSDQQAQEYLNILKEDGQDEVLDSIEGTENGRFSVDSNVGVPVNVVRETDENGDRKIFVVFKRWTQFREHRNASRSLNYPFGVIELKIDSETGKGEGRYIPAARIRFKNKKGKAPEIEVENFTNLPARLLAVQSSKARG